MMNIALYTIDVLKHSARIKKRDGIFVSGCSNIYACQFIFDIEAALAAKGL